MPRRQEPTLTSGMKTSEFLLSLAVIVAATVLLAIGKIEPAWWAVATAGQGAGYAISRGVAKNGADASR